MKPIDLIVSNVMHEVMPHIAETDGLVAIIGKIKAEAERRGVSVAHLPAIPNRHDDIARKLLCEIAHEANIDRVYAALKAVGAPATADDIKEGIQAVKDRQPA